MSNTYLWVAPAFAILAVCLVGCAADRPHRTVETSTPTSSDCPVKKDGVQPSFEICSYPTADDTKGEYYVGYVEFDDQGWFQDIEQRNNLFTRLREHRAKTGEQFLIVVFAHGWKHNAGEDDENVAKFHELLKDLDLHERAAKANNGKARKVIGVYLGWRGASVTVPVLKELTFWTRKNAAERVGGRSAKQLLMELNQFRAFANGWGDNGDRLAGPNQTQLVLIGHSFGGLIMYHALHTELMDRALRVDTKGNYRTAKSFGDFILLVNPAFEGAAYESLWRAANSRCYSDQQRPIMAVVTSRADWATRYAFPVGRFYTITQTAPHEGERETVFNTVGHLDRYKTHTLSAEGRVDKADKPAVAVRSLAATMTVIETLRSKPHAPTLENKEVTYDGGKLTWIDNPYLEKKAARHFPYLVISTDKEMIKDHNDIWRPQFRGFMLDFVSKQVMEEPPVGLAIECAAFQ